MTRVRTRAGGLDTGTYAVQEPTPVTFRMQGELRHGTLVGARDPYATGKHVQFHVPVQYQFSTAVVRLPCGGLHYLPVARLRGTSQAAWKEARLARE